VRLLAYDPKQALIIQEGFVPSFYFDHLKKLTIGVGHLVQKGSPYYKDKTILKRAEALLAENGGDIKKTNALLAKDPFFQRPKEELMKVFDEDYAYMEGLARKNYPGFDQHPQNVQDSLVNMTFQLGNKPTRWPSFNKALKARDYEEAAYHLADSDWFAVQTPNRAAAVIDRFAYGTEYVERPGEQDVNRTYMRDNVRQRKGMLLPTKNLSSKFQWHRASVQLGASLTLALVLMRKTLVFLLSLKVIRPLPYLSAW
jgi:GH24 family phage-related lysozyme (muramidase)